MAKKFKATAEFRRDEVKTPYTRIVQGDTKEELLEEAKKLEANVKTPGLTLNRIAVHGINTRRITIWGSGRFTPLANRMLDGLEARRNDLKAKRR